ncbi:hypothetical protein [Candidatus Electronema sp. PJ]|jgi:hypothetical protein|uniref:hypothetical protein n=1 Tax=Candidatus Electronema sp. PJ TaxID=3401572 RepID=UPI003AA94DC7
MLKQGFIRDTIASTYTAVTQQDGGWWVGWIEAIPGINYQEETWEKLLILPCRRQVLTLLKS